MTASKQKGTGGETELLRLFEEAGFTTNRTGAGEVYDLRVIGYLLGQAGTAVEALATRPDRGRWLVTVELPRFIEFLRCSGLSAHVEVKRYKRFSLHGIWESKFGRKT